MADEKYEAGPSAWAAKVEEILHDDDEDLGGGATASKIVDSVMYGVPFDFENDPEFLLTVLKSLRAYQGAVGQLITRLEKLAALL
jgi:hypothetical protein